MNIRRSPRNLVMILTAGLCLASWAPAARGEIPVVNQEFLDAHLPEMKALAQAAPSATTAQEAADLIRRILTTRALAERDLYQIEPEGSLNAITTLDAYDDEAVLTLYAVTHAYTLKDTVLPPNEYLIGFQNLTANAPDLGNSPVGFMVLGMTALLMTAADSLAQDPDLDPSVVAKTAVQMSHLGADLFHEIYLEAREDPTMAQSSGQFYRNSVIMRLRCPKDHAEYQLDTLKNRLDDSGDIYSMSYLSCTLCGETRVVEFRQELISRLNRMGERQDLEALKGRRKTKRGVDP